METKVEYKTETKPVAPMYRVLVVIRAEKYDNLNPTAAPQLVAARTLRFIGDDLWSLRQIDPSKALGQTYNNATFALVEKELEEAALKSEGEPIFLE